MTDIRAESLAVLDLTRAILAAAGKDAWEEVPALEERRRQVLEKLFSREIREEQDILLLTDMVEQLREMDRSTVEMVLRERDAVAAELTRLRSARRQRQVYLDVAEAGL